MRNYRYQFCAIQKLLSGPGLPHFSVDKLESFLQQISNQSLTIYQTSYGYFTPHVGFSLITLLLRKLHCLFFKTLKAIDSLTHVSNFLFREIYLTLLINFKMRLSLGLSCLKCRPCLFFVNNYLHN